MDNSANSASMDGIDNIASMDGIDNMDNIDMVMTSATKLTSMLSGGSGLHDLVELGKPNPNYRRAAYACRMGRLGMREGKFVDKIKSIHGAAKDLFAPMLSAVKECDILRASASKTLCEFINEKDREVRRLRAAVVVSVRKVKEANAAKDRRHDCRICYKPIEELYASPVCRHAFCKICCLRKLGDHAKCPVCRVEDVGKWEQIHFT